MAYRKFQMPGQIIAAQHASAETVMIAEFAHFFRPSPLQYMPELLSNSLTGLAIRK